MPSTIPNLFGLEADEMPLSQSDPVCTCHECQTEHDASDSREYEGNQYCPECCHCPECDCVYNREDGYDVNGTSYCSDCVYHCESCNESTTIERDIHTCRTSSSRHSTSELCEACSWRCDDCRDWYSNEADSGSNSSGERVCTSCAEHYSSCEACNDTFHEDNIRFHEGNSACYCESCYPSEDAEDDDDDSEDDSEDSGEPVRYTAPIAGQVVQNHSHKPRPVFNVAPGESADESKTVFIGWELEVDRAEEADNLDDDVTELGLADHPVLYPKADGSLDYGFEIVSHPGSWAYWQSFDWNFARETVTRGYRSYDTTTCGMHVHISKAAFSELERYKLLLFFRGNKPLIETLSRREPKQLKDWASIDASDNGRLLRKVKHGHEEKYEAINFKPAKTVEIRIFRGTLKPESIKRNLALVVAMVHFVKFAGMEALTANEFLAWLYKHGRGVVGQKPARDLCNWVRRAIGHTCEPDTGH